MNLLLLILIPQLCGEGGDGGPRRAEAENTVQHHYPDNNQEFRRAVIANRFFLIFNYFSSSQRSVTPVS